MPKRTKNRGICSTCKLESECTFPKDAKRSVLQCEEFEPYEPPPRKKISKGIKVKVKPRDKSMGEETSSYKGLCCNCENRATCTFPKPEGGVWHCEEYQ